MNSWWPKNSHKAKNRWWWWEQVIKLGPADEAENSLTKLRTADGTKERRTANQIRKDKTNEATAAGNEAWNSKNKNNCHAWNRCWTYEHLESIKFIYVLTQSTTDELRQFMKPRTVDAAKNSLEAKTAEEAKNSWLHWEQPMKLKQPMKLRTADS